ncbi:MAG: hypothetical protein RLZZ127_1121 [Planctomycetota bacterium]|jgi:hemerythrin-like domain-containing protein
MSCHAADLPPVDLARVSAVSILSAEHRVILQVIDCLTAMTVAAVRGQGPDWVHARQALTIVRTFADRCHHGKEEDILFPELEALEPGFGPTAVMRHEHVIGRAHVAAAQAAIEAADAGAFAEAASAYIDLLRAHIDKEDGILFPIAQRLLTAEADARILAAYRDVERHDMGDGVHEQMLAVADALADTYGVPRADADPAIMALLTAVCGCKTQSHGGHACAVPPAEAERAAEWQRLAGLGAKVARVHGAAHPEMVSLASEVRTLADRAPSALAPEQAARLRDLTGGFRPWPGACGSVRALFAGLEAV